MFFTDSPMADAIKFLFLPIYQGKKRIDFFLLFFPLYSFVLSFIETLYLKVHVTGREGDLD